MKHSYEELANIRATIREDLLSITIRLIRFELPFEYRPIRELQSTLPFFLAVLPFSCIGCSISPLADCDSVHLSVLPLSVILPSLLLTDEKPGPLLVAFDILTFKIVTILPLSNTKAPWEPESKLTSEALVLRDVELSIPVHFSTRPVTLV